MKKYLFGIVCLLSAAIMFGCVKDENKNETYTGYVGEIRDGEFDFTFDNNGIEDTMIVISENKNIKEGDNVTIVTNGTMMMSEPARVNALEVKVNENKNDESLDLDVYYLERIDDQYILVTDNKTEGDMVYTYQVDVSKIDRIPDISNGMKMTIKYNGVMTKSIPPILTADEIIIDFPER